MAASLAMAILETDMVSKESDEIFLSCWSLLSGSVAHDAMFAIHPPLLFMKYMFAAFGAIGVVFATYVGTLLAK